MSRIFLETWEKIDAQVRCGKLLKGVMFVGTAARCVNAGNS